MSNRHVSLCLCITHTKPLIRVALTLGPLKTLGDGGFPVGEEGGDSVFLKDSFNQLAVWFGQPAEEGRAQGNTWGGKKEWMHNPITLYFPSSPASGDWRNWAQQHICSSPPCKAQEMLPLHFPPHFLHFCPLSASPWPPESRAQQLHVWRSPSSVLPENSICSRHLEWDSWRIKQDFSPVEGKMHKMIPGSFSLFPPHLPCPSVPHARFRCRLAEDPCFTGTAGEILLAWQNQK